MDSETTTTKWRSPSGRFAVRLVHLAAGWRYWAFERFTGADDELGLSADGYTSMAMAVPAAKRAEAKPRSAR